jgi:bacillithiol biosynthesis deacetylase BshB1
VRVLAIGAHPDDVDLYAGGLVAGLARRGATVALVDLTAGELGTRGTPEIRAEEAAAAARALGVASRECLGLPDGGLVATDPGQTRALVEAMRRHRPELILAPWPDDPHPDHREAAGLARRARFLARVARWPADGEPFRPGPILFYEQKTPFEPDLVVDVGADLEAKRAAIRAFATQFFREPDDPVETEISDPGFHAMLEARSKVHGARIGVAWGEGYKRDEPFAVRDPLVLLPGAGDEPSSPSRPGGTP